MAQRQRTFTDEQKRSVTRGHNFWIGELQMLAQIARATNTNSKSGVLRQLLRREHKRLGLELPNESDST